MRKFSIHQSNASHYGPQAGNESTVVRSLFEMLFRLEVISNDDVPYVYECHYFVVHSMRGVVYDQ